MIQPRSSPGGIALQDYHWSGGIYSPQFVSYDNWGQSLPQDLHGFNTSDSEMIPSRSYQNQIQQFPIPARNYELLETTPITSHESFPTFELSKRQENFDKNWRYQGIVMLVLLILMIYFFDKTFGKNIAESNIWFKISILILLSIGVYVITIV
jgi:hypothetical protein